MLSYKLPLLLFASFGSFPASFSDDGPKFWCNHCRSEQKEECWNNTAGDFCESKYGACYTYVDENHIRRGCATLGEYGMMPLAGLLNRNHTVLCSDESLCNNHRIVHDICYKYKYYTHLSYFDGENGLRQKPIQCRHTLSKSGCYYRIDATGDSVKAGCVADIVQDDPADPTRITTFCTGDSCNSPSKYLTCLTHGALDIDDVFAIPKSHYVLCAENDKCYTYVSDDDLMERGCLSKANETIKAECDQSNEGCALCDDAVACNFRYAQRKARVQQQQYQEWEHQQHQQQQEQQEQQQEQQEQQFQPQEAGETEAVSQHQQQQSSKPSENGTPKSTFSLSILLASYFVVVFISK